LENRKAFPIAALAFVIKVAGLMETTRRLLKNAPTLCNHLWRQWLRPLAVSAASVLPVKSALADLNWVPTGSMKPKILEGDMILVNKLAYDLKLPFTLTRLAKWSDPKRGDIVVLFSPEDGMRLVKRVVAGPGDTIAMKGDVLILNGKPLNYGLQNAEPFKSEINEESKAIVAKESLCGTDHWVMALPGRSAMRDFTEMTVPEGRYFVMGDSRDNSKDSRFIGFIERKQIVGRAEGIVVSANLKRFCQPRFGRFFSKLDG
jgi:signal peptidase I